MRIKKIRGHRRIWNKVENWRKANLKLDLEYLKQNERDHAKIWVHPFSGITLTNSQNPEPKAETKKRILNGLIDIYESWKNQLEELNEPYYLKIWLYEPRFSKSQVVCAFGNSIDFYNTSFNSPENPKEFKTESYGNIKNRLENFKWENHLDQEFLFSIDLGNPEDYENEKDYWEEQKWFNDRLKKKYIKETLNDKTESYSFEIGEVWIGENKLK